MYKNISIFINDVICKFIFYHLLTKVYFIQLIFRMPSEKSQINLLFRGNL